MVLKNSVLLQYNTIECAILLNVSAICIIYLKIGSILLLQTLNCTIHLKSVLFSKRFVPLPKRFVSFSKRFVPSPKYSVSFSKHFVLSKAFKSVRAKRSLQRIRKSSGVFIVIIKMANWQWSRKLIPFIWRIILLFHISGLFLWNCFDLQDNFW